MSFVMDVVAKLQRLRGTVRRVRGGTREAVKVVGTHSGIDSPRWRVI